MHAGSWLGLLLQGTVLAIGAAAPLQGVPRDIGPVERLAPLRVPFVGNCGQWDEKVAFAAKTGTGTVFVTRDGQIVYSLIGGTSERWTLIETAISGTPVPGPGQVSVTRVSSLRGRDPSRWQTGLPSYEEIHLGEVWRGVSVSLRARDGSIEKLFTVRPGASIGRVRLRLDGASSLRTDRDGALVAQTGRGEVRFTAPVAYQERDGSRRSVTAAYVVHGTRYGFRLGSYDRSLPVVVDPVLQSTYFGGTDNDAPSHIAIQGTSGDFIVAGWTFSTDFPGTAGGAQPSPGGPNVFADGFVARFDPTLATLLQATYLGGFHDDSIHAITVHPVSGEVFAAGLTYSTDFPGTSGGAQPTPGAQGDSFVVRLDPDLTSILQATYLGGGNTDDAFGASIDPLSGNVLVAGYTYSSDFPNTAGGAQPASAGGVEGFVARFDVTLTTLLQATYLGGSGSEFLQAIAIHPTSGEVLVTGRTESTDLPGVAGGAQAVHAGSDDGFLARLDSSLTTLLQSTYLGGSDFDEVRCIAIHPSSGEIFVAGYSASLDFPGAASGPQSTHGGGIEDGFVARLAPSLTGLIHSSYLGGSERDRAEGLAIHPASGEVLVAGSTDADFPGTTDGAQPLSGGNGDGFLVRLDATLGTRLVATFLGGTGYDDSPAIAIDPAGGEVFVCGSTESTDLPGATGGAHPSSLADRDGFVTRLTPDLEALLSPVGMAIDPLPNPGDGDLILQPGEQVPVIPAWKNLSDSDLAPNGQASDFSGPTGATYTILNDAVSYGTMPPGGQGIPASAYSMSISIPASRPLHWDAAFTEALDVPLVLPYRHVLHVGDSFIDVPRTNSFYPFIENVLHHDITSGCGGNAYCPSSSTTRAQMAYFLLKAKHGSAYVPPQCTGIFGDVACPFGYASWIEQLFHEGITAGCGGGNYCPNNPVTRAQMAAFLLKSSHGAAHVPPPCTSTFGDVPCPSLFADWIEELAAEGVTAGCSGGNYCPNSPNTRGQMAVFIVKTFGLRLYGP